MLHTQESGNNIVAKLAFPLLNGLLEKRYHTVGVAHATLVFARTSGKAGAAGGITAFIVPTEAPGHNILYNHWTFNMPSDHAETELKDVPVPDSAILHEEGDGLVASKTDRVCGPLVRHDGY
jgi:acyl-CoA dehydrogenase